MARDPPTARHQRGREVSVDRAGQVSLRAGGGSLCELSDVTRSTVPDTKECATREPSLFQDTHRFSGWKSEWC